MLSRKIRASVANGGGPEPIIPDIMAQFTIARPLSDNYTLATGGSSVMMRSLSSKSTGRYYAELTTTNSTSARVAVGLVNGSTLQRVGSVIGLWPLEYGVAGMSWYQDDAYYEGSKASAVYSNVGLNSTQGFFIDVDTRKVWGWKSGVGWVENPKIFVAGGDLFLAVGSYNIGPAILHMNLGQEPFIYPYGSPPSDVVLGWPA